MEIADLIQSIGILIAIIALIITIAFNRGQTRILNKQLRLNFFADYTKRYQEIVLNFPDNINDPMFDFNNLPIDIKSKTIRNMRVYFDLCSEEYDLWKTGYIDDRIWNNWNEGIKFAFSKKAFKDAWTIIKLDSIYYPEFTEWIINEMLN
jgi:hypothetical protein